MEKNRRNIKKYWYGIIGATALLFWGGIMSASAATEFMTSWQAKTYTPEWYRGVAFPTYQSFITVGFELIENGKMVDLSKTVVRWYVDDKLFKNESNGLGIKKVIVYNQKYGGDVSNIKISLPSYKGGVLEKTINIPIKNPEVMMDVPFFQRRVPKGDSLISAWPFYFNTTSANTMNLQWSAEGGENQGGRIGEAFRLNVEQGVEPGTKYTIRASIANVKKAAENAMQSVIIETM